MMTGGVLLPNRAPGMQKDVPKRRVREIVSVMRQAANKLKNGGVEEKFEATALVFKAIRMLEGTE